MSDQYVRRFQQQSRDCFECLICHAKGSALAGQTVDDLIQAHFEKARLHFKAVAVRPITKEERRKGLAGWLIDEMKIFGASEGICQIAADIAQSWYRAELEDKDAEIERLKARLGEPSI